MKKYNLTAKNLATARFFEKQNSEAITILELEGLTSNNGTKLIIESCLKPIELQDLIIESRVYTLNGKQNTKLKKLYPIIDPDRDDFDEALQWIELNGQYLNTAQCYNY